MFNIFIPVHVLIPNLLYGYVFNSFLSPCNGVGWDIVKVVKIQVEIQLNFGSTCILNLADLSKIF